MELLKEYYTVLEVANMFSVGQDTIYREIQKGRFVGALKIRSLTRIPKDAIEKYKEQNS